MQDDFESVYDMIEHAIDLAFTKGNMQLKFYEFLKYRKTKKYEVDAFIESSTAANVSNLVLELELYLKGRDKISKEAYGHLSKPQARKIKDYLYKILTDAWKYEQERKPGRKPGTKNKKRKSAITNK